MVRFLRSPSLTQPRSLENVSRTFCPRKQLEFQAQRHDRSRSIRNRGVLVHQSQIPSIRLFAARTDMVLSRSGNCPKSSLLIAKASYWLRNAGDYCRGGINTSILRFFILYNYIIYPTRPFLFRYSDKFHPGRCGPGDKYRGNRQGCVVVLDCILHTTYKKMSSR